jgi:hypothetical protein
MHWKQTEIPQEEQAMSNCCVTDTIWGYDDSQVFGSLFFGIWRSVVWEINKEVSKKTASSMFLPKLRHKSTKLHDVTSRKTMIG